MESIFELIVLFGGIFLLIAVVSFMAEEGIDESSPLAFIGVILFIGLLIKTCMD